MKQKIKTYFKGLFEYLKELTLPKKIIFLILIFTNIVEVYYAVDVMHMSDTKFIDLSYMIPLTIDDFLFYDLPFIAFVLIILSATSKHINYVICLLIAIVLAANPIVRIFLAFLPATLSEYFGL